MKHVKLDQSFKDILCCPICKASVALQENQATCKKCGSKYLSRNGIWDFRILPPDYCLPSVLKEWRRIQDKYESIPVKLAQLTSEKQEEVYFSEINSVKEVYTQEFSINGKVIDVGGEVGRLRHFLNDDSQYISVDPFLDVFQGLESKTSLMKAYPCLSNPCNFLCCHAERLPFLAGSFDWVHMRSVLDHFFNPYIALKEAYRVLNEDGKLMIGLQVTGGESSLSDKGTVRNLLSRIKKKMRDEGFIGVFRSIVSRLANRHLSIHRNSGHMFHWRYDDLLDLVRITGFEVEKIHWPKPPFEHCIWLSARKLSSQHYTSNNEESILR